MTKKSEAQGMTPEDARKIIRSAAEAPEGMKDAILNSMTLQELIEFHGATLEAAQTIAAELLAQKIKMGGMLKEIQSNMTDKQYREILRKSKTRAKDAREMILLYESCQK